MTFSIVARSADGESWGVAVASKFLAVGSMVPAAVAQVGAIATQADANVAYKGIALAHLDEGATASVALHRLLEEDDGRDHRQVGIVDADGGAASHTGTACMDWAGSLIGDGYAIQGNVLIGSEVVEAMQEAWEASEPDTALAERLFAALQAGDAAGGDRRGRQSAALLVVRDGAGYGGQGRHRRRPSGGRPPGPVHRAGPAARPQRLLPHRVDRRRRRSRSPTSSGRRSRRRRWRSVRATSKRGSGPRTTRCVPPATARGSTSGSSRSFGTPDSTA